MTLLENMIDSAALTIDVGVALDESNVETVSGRA